MKLLITLLCALVASSAYGQGASLLGMCHPDFKCDSINRMFVGQEVIVTGWLENTFGTTCSCADSLLNDPRPKIVRVHIMNSPCLRNKRCGPYEVLYKESVASASTQFGRGRGKAVEKFKRSLKRLKARLAGVKDLTCYVSPCLECDLNERARRFISSVVLDALPDCRLVDSVYRQRCLPGAVCEKHGDKPRVTKPCIVDLDGIDGRDVDLKQYVESYKECDLVYYWEPWMNCIKGSFKDPRARRCENDNFRRVRGVICQYFYPLLGTC